VLIEKNRPGYDGVIENFFLAIDCDGKNGETFHSGF